MFMNNNSKYKFLTYLFLLLSIFVIFLFSKNIYMQMTQNIKQKDALVQQLQEKNEQYQKVSKIKSDIDSGQIKDIDFDKFLSNFSEDELIEYFYAYANNNPTKIQIQSIWLSDWVYNEFWFKEAKVDINAVFSTEKDMLDMITFLQNSEKYNLFIHEFTYPFWNAATPFSVNIPLKVLYK